MPLMVCRPVGLNKAPSTYGRWTVLNAGGALPERAEAEAFLTLAEELHFGRTAERLRLTTRRVTPRAQARAATSRVKAAMMTATRT